MSANPQRDSILAQVEEDILACQQRLKTLQDMDDAGQDKLLAEMTKEIQRLRRLLPAAYTPPPTTLTQ